MSRQTVTLIIIMHRGLRILLLLWRGWRIKRLHQTSCDISRTAIQQPCVETTALTAARSTLQDCRVFVFKLQVAVSAQGGTSARGWRAKPGFTMDYLCNNLRRVPFLTMPKVKCAQDPPLCNSQGVVFTYLLSFVTGSLLHSQYLLLQSIPLLTPPPPLSLSLSFSFSLSRSQISTVFENFLSLPPGGFSSLSTTSKPFAARRRARET